MSTELKDALKKHFGFDEFLDGQLPAISKVTEGKDVCLVMPTGAGKSICYQLPALLKPGYTIVISPLIALMKDQVDNLVRKGIAAVYINSSQHLLNSRRTWQKFYVVKLNCSTSHRNALKPAAFARLWPHARLTAWLLTKLTASVNGATISAPTTSAWETFATLITSRKSALLQRQRLL